MEKELKKLLLTELNMVSYKVGNTEDLTDDKMVKALTVNENLLSLGYCLKPEDIVNLAASESCDSLFKDLAELLPDVKAKPMYPDFPTQVMEMSTAEFRFHQWLHYSSTYGVELFTGTKVTKGWLPSVKSTVKNQKDTFLLDEKLLELVAEDAICEKALRTILGKRERMTLPETEIVKTAIHYCDADNLSDIRIPFKENLDLLFDQAMTLDRDDAIRLICAVCKHTGDVLKNIYRLLKANKYHFKTAQKKTFVRAIESYPANDFKTNLMKSKHDRERTLLILQKLDFNTYSKSVAHRNEVDALRKDELKSWNAIADRMIENHEPRALDFVAKRPGNMLRMVNRLLTLGYSEEDIAERLCKNAAYLNTQTIVTLLNTFAAMTREGIISEMNIKREELKNKYYFQYLTNSERAIEEDRKYAIESAQMLIEEEYSNGLYYLNCEISKAKSEWFLFQIKADEQTEIDSIEKPYRDEIKKIYDDIRNELAVLNAELYDVCHKLKPYSRMMKNREVIRDSMVSYHRRLGENDKAESIIANFPICNEKIEKLRIERNKLQTQMSDLKAERSSKIEAIRQRMQEETKSERSRIEEKYSLKLRIRQSKLAEIEAEYLLKEALLTEEKEKKLVGIQERLAKINSEYDEKLRNLPQRIKEIQEEEAKEKSLIDAKEVVRLKQLETLPIKKKILGKVLKAHFELIETPLKGKKIFFDLDAFDLDNSQILCNNKSAEGGYIPSGIAYRIPDEAKRVRFFVYWNDKDRVDIDLHANGTTIDGRGIHVGWNGEFNTYGVTHSGDITHSNAAEYIDVDLSKPTDRIYTNVSLFSGKRSLKDVEECYVGMMAVDKIGQSVKLYDRANCYFAHELRMESSSLFYGYINVQKRFVKFIGRSGLVGSYKWSEDTSEDLFSLKKYLDILVDSQQATVVSDRDEADIILAMGKSVYENAVSLIDNNFFMDAM